MSFHLYRLNELYSNPSGTIQFIELSVGNVNGESFWAGVSISSTRNGVANTFNFPSDLSSTATANTAVLIATQGFADLGVVTPDFIIPSGFLSTAGGSLNFGGVDAITYPALPGDGVRSVTRTGEPSLATPRNFAGASGNLPTASVLTITGTAGDDTLTGTASNEVVDGLAGSDTLKSGGGNDALRGGTGDDVLFSGAGDDMIDGGEGYDYLYYTDATAGVTINMATGRATGGAGSDAIAGIELVFGSPFNDTFVGNDVSVGFLGGDGNDTITGGAGRDHLEGNGGDDVIDGKDGADIVAYYSAAFAVNVDLTMGVASGGLGNDTLRNIEDVVGSVFGDTLTGDANRNTLDGSSGNDTLNGGSGLDTAIFTGTRADHTITRTASGWTVSSPVDGTDAIQNIERLQFSNETLALDIAGSAGQAYRIYQAAFNRTPDNGGLKYWINRMDGGTTQDRVAAEFIGSPEFQTLYGTNPGNADFLTRLYSNVLHRTPDPGGYSWWLGQLDAGVYDKPSALASFAESNENQLGVIGMIENGIDLFN